jgi:hypothetical protein
MISPFPDSAQPLYSSFTSFFILTLNFYKFFSTNKLGGKAYYF